MAGQFYIKVFAIFACLALIGCGKKRAPQYDGRHGEVLQEGANAILSEDDDAALAALSRQVELSGADDYTEAAELEVKRRKHLKEVSALLDRADYEGLRLFLHEKLATGDASTELMEMESLPDALQALLIFRAKMPWEDSKTLAEALSTLEQYYSILSKSQAFKDFHNSQLVCLGELRRAEAAERAKKKLSECEIAIISGDTAHLQFLINEFKLDQPEHLFFKCREIFLGNKNIEMTPSRAYIVAAASVWDKLSSQRKKEIANELETCKVDSDISLHYILAMIPESDLKHARTVRDFAIRNGFEPDSAFVRMYVGNLLKGRTININTPCISPLGH